MGEPIYFFDRIMEKSVFRIFQPFYQRNREILLYLFFGGLTFLVSVATYALFNVVCSLNELLANIFSWFIAVYFAYVVNHKYVFQSNPTGKTRKIKQMADFFLSRLTTFFIEEVILLLFITVLSFNSMFIKIVAQIVVIVLNYVLSKLYVFKKK